MDRDAIKGGRRLDEALRGLKKLYDSFVEPNPDWATELLAKLK